MFSHICPQYRSHDVCTSRTVPTAMLEAEAVAGKITFQIAGMHPGSCLSVQFLS